MKKWTIMLSFIVISLFATLEIFVLPTYSGRSSEIIRSNYLVKKMNLRKTNEWTFKTNTSDDPMILELTSLAAFDLFRNRSEADLELLSMAERLHLNLAIIHNFLQVTRRNSLSKNQQISLAQELSKGDLRLEVELINWVRNNGSQPGTNVFKKSIPVDGGPVFENIRRIDDHH